MRRIHVKYVSYVVCLTGKMKETVETEARNVGELIKELDDKYPGIARLFFPAEVDRVSILNSAVYLRRRGVPPQGVFDPSFTLHDDDVYMFW